MTVEYSILIKDGFIVDGLSTQWRRADVGIYEGRIVKIGRISTSKADLVIDARGLIVAPGFIDMHSHSDITALIYPEANSKVYQGVATEVVGNCGLSPAPVNRNNLSLLKQYLDSFFGKISEYLPWTWLTLKEYYEKVANQGISVNMVPLVGHGVIRIAVMGFETYKPSRGELDSMKMLVKQAMEEGAFGMSVGLTYPPGLFTETDELVELARIIGEYDGLYASHIRDEGSNIMNAIMEAIRIGREANVSIEISHIKVMGRKNWGRSSEIIKAIEEARKSGVNITADQYPYIAGQTGLYAILPPWVHEGGIRKLLERISNPTIKDRIRKDMEDGVNGWRSIASEIGWDNIVIATTEKNKFIEGKTISQIAELWGLNPLETVFKLLRDENGSVSIILFYGCEDDLKNFLSRRWVMIGSDHNGIKVGEGPLGGIQHPRAYGTFPRVIAKYVREDILLSLGEAIRRMTSLPARKLKLKDRGILREGMWADIVVFDVLKLIDKATYQNPTIYAEGIEYLLVNGIPVIDKGKHTGAKPGKVLSRT
ncbi:MAG: D-aminoacylase [Candidatus Methanomethylicia archaeon]